MSFRQEVVAGGSLSTGAVAPDGVTTARSCSTSSRTSSWLYDVSVAGEFDSGRPHQLFQVSNVGGYDVASDGRFVFVEDVLAEGETQTQASHSHHPELVRRVPRPRIA